MMSGTTMIIFCRLFGALLLGLLSCLMTSGCSSLTALYGNSDDRGRQVKNDLGRTIEYKVRFSGIDSQRKSLLNTLRQVSTSLRLQERPPPTLAGLRRRAKEDVAQFQVVLRSFGFYDGRVTYSIEEEPRKHGPDIPVESAILLYQIDPGKVYLLSEADLEIIHPDRTVERPMNDEELKASDLSPGMQAEAGPIIEAEQRAVMLFRNKAYPLARAEQRKVTINKDKKSLRVVYRINAGKKADFGVVRVSGAEKVDTDFIAGYRSWQLGNPFSPGELKTTQEDLAKTNLFESVTVRPAGEINGQGEIPIEIKVTEREQKTVGGGLNYSTADGIGANIFWEHRNLFGAGEKLRFYLDGSELQQGLEINFRKPQFFKRRQDLVIDAHSKEFNSNAYQGELADSFAGIERRIGDYWSVTAGIIVEYSDLTGADSPNETFYLGGLRGLVRRDSSDSPLDPITGSRLELAVTPLTSLAGADTRFIVVSLHGSDYYAFDEAGRYVLAGRGQIGTVWGEEQSSLPSNKRFYAGGGGSIRGYEYQKAGPLDENNDPIGGRSILEAGLEFRAHLTDTIGVVPFIEGGNVFETIYPDNFDLLWAAGLGLRYYTGIGPIRFDVAVPLNKRDNIDSNYQIYISIGQAF